MNENIDDSTKESNTADGDEKDTILEEGSVKVMKEIKLTIGVRG